MPPFPLDSLSRRLLRQAVLRVHPDIFAGVNLEAASFNAESLVKLNAFVESLAQGKRPRATRLDFWIREDERNAENDDGGGNRAATLTTRRVSATLPRSGSLLPLFAALGLATAEELLAAVAQKEEEEEYSEQLEGEYSTDSLGAEEADLLEWLASAARSAAAAGGRRAALSAAVGAAAADAAQRHALSRPVLLPDCGLSASRASLARALKAVRALDEAMALFEEEEGEEEEREGEASTGEEEGEEGLQRRRGDRGGDRDGGGDDVCGCNKKPFRGLRVRLYTPPSLRRKRPRSKRAEEGDEAEAAEGNGEGDGEDDEGEASWATAWVSESDGALCVLVPPQRRRRSNNSSPSSSPSPSPSPSSSILRALRSESADLPTARALSAARAYWQRRAAELAGPAAEALGVERVSWAEEEDADEEEEEEGEGGAAGGRRRTGVVASSSLPPPPSPARRFVAWAAAVLGEAGSLSPSSSSAEEEEHEEGFGRDGQSDEQGFPPPPPSPRRQRLSLSVVVHPEEPESLSSLAFFVAGNGGVESGGEGFSPEASDAAAASSSTQGAPSVPFQVSAGTLHVSAASPPAQLLSFLRSDDGAAAALAAEREAEERARAELEMEAAARALGAAAVVRVSPSASLGEVVEAARRLAGAAPLLAAAGIDLAGVTLAIDDVFEAWHDEEESGSDSDFSGNGDSEDEEEDEDEYSRRRKRGRYCGILSVPFDFEAPDLGAAVARMLRSSLPPSEEEASTFADKEEHEADQGEAFPGFEPSEAGAENVFDVSAPGATAGARAAGRRRMLLPPPSPLLFLRGGGRGRKTRSARRPSPTPPTPLRAAVAPRAVSSSASSFSARSPFFRRMLFL